MSFLFGGGRPQPSSEQKIAAAENEVEMISDMFRRYDECTPSGLDRVSIGVPVCHADSLVSSRLSETCFSKCVPADYREADLNKGESVCIDRCVAKFFEVNVKVSEKMQGDASRASGVGPGAGGVFGM